MDSPNQTPAEAPEQQSLDFSEDVKVRTKGHDTNAFQSANFIGAVGNGKESKPNMLYRDYCGNGIQDRGYLHENGGVVHHSVSSGGSGSVGTMFEEVDSDEEIIHRVNGLFHNDVNVHTYHDNPNSNSDSDDVVFEQKDDLDGTTEALFQTKPLMHPRKHGKRPPSSSNKRTKHAKVRTRHGRGFLHKCVWPMVYIIIGIGAVVMLVFIIFYLVKILHGQTISGGGMLNKNIVGCSNLSKSTVWTTGIPKLVTESSIRLVDVNEDGVLDILFGFATGAESYNAPDYMCDVYFNGTHPCLGGLMALDGKDGKEIWRHYTSHEVFAVNCGYDLDEDGVEDCLAGGRLATFEVVSGKTGQKLWAFMGKEKVEDMNLYTGQFVPDLDGDGIPEVLNAHGGDPFGEPGSVTRLKGKLLLFSGQTGAVLQSATVPDGKECYYSPVLLQRRGVLGVLFGTGGETHGGSLWWISLSDLYKGNMHKAYAIYTDKYKGIMTPPVLLDMTGDGTNDIVFAAFNSSMMLVDGDNFKTIWSFTYPSSETYVTPAPGYYTDDDIPDFIIHWQYGPGFPIYYHSVTTIVDGRTGEAVLTPYIRDSVGAQSSPLTVSVEGYGNDLFLYYTADCDGHAGEGGEYTFINGTNIHEQSRSDVCFLRFNTKSVNKLNVMNRHTDSNGLNLYNSVEQNDLEHSMWVNTTVEALDFLYKYPEHNRRHEKWEAWKAHYLNTGMYEEPIDYDKDENIDEDSELYETLSTMLHNILGKEDQNTDYAGDSNPQPFSSEKLKDFVNNDPTIRDYYDKYKQGESIDDSNLNSYKAAIENGDSEDEGITSRYRGGEKWLEKKPGYAAGHNSRGGNDYVQSRGKSPVLSREKYGSPALSRRRPYPAHVEDSQGINSNRDKIYNTEQRLQDRNYRLKSSLYDSPNGNDSPKYDDSSLYNSNRFRPSLLSNERGAAYSSPLYSSRGYESPYEKQSAYRGRTRAHNKDFGSSWGSIVGNKKRKKRSPTKLTGKKNVPKSKKIRRHVGLHNGGDLQRLISTGTLAPTLLPPSHPAYNYSIDVIFSTCWIFPADTEVILPEDKKCIDEKMQKEQQRFNPNSKYYGMDDDGYEHAVTHECLVASGHVMPEGGTYNSQQLRDPYIRHMGQMTMYRLTLTCECEVDPLELSKAGKRCSRILPYQHQQWPAYMGYGSDSIVVPRK